MLDFSDARDQEELKELNSEKIKTDLHNRLEEALLYLFPHGKIRRDQFMIGDIYGNPGDSLHVELSGPKIGLWHDFATGEGGDIISLWGAANGLNSHNDFPEIIDSIQNWLGTPQYHIKKTKPIDSDNLGALTHKWDYHDSEGNIIACVYRYDTPAGKKYRPWNVKARKYGAPDPRPLYNQLAIKNADEIILAEGEKCADALISQGICATTAMGGANAPIDKTDWTPLAGKHVIIWPDNDQAGLKYAEALKNKLPTIYKSLSIISPPSDKPEGWDAADAIVEGMDVQNFITISQQIKSQKEEIKSFKIKYSLNDHTPMPDDIIAPRILTPGGLLVFGGAPKVGKTDLLLNWLAHMAAGLPFLGMTPPKPLKIFFFQAEIGYHYMRERIQKLNFDKETLKTIGENLAITYDIKMLFDKAGIEKARDYILKDFNPDELDIIAIDPLRNFYDGSDENSNTEMLHFLTQRIEKLRSSINPNIGLILTHHTKKINKKMLEEDPFQALSGAGSLRGYYSTGIIFFKPDETQSTRYLIFELRNGPHIPEKIVDKIDNVWQEIEEESERLVKQSYGEILDNERRRKHDVILQIIFEEAQKGNLYTPSQFAQNFENRESLGGNRTIIERINVLATKGYIKFNKTNAERSKHGFMCVEGMEIPIDEEIVNQDTGELSKAMKPCPPTHYKSQQTGVLMPVENPDVWIYPQNDD